MYVTFKRNVNTFQRLSFTTLWENWGQPEALLLQPRNQPPKTFTKILEDENQVQQLAQAYQVEQMKQHLTAIHPAVREVYQEDMSQYYESFHIPKHSGGFRRIDAPNNQLKELLRSIKDTFEEKLLVLPHTKAFAYVKGKSTKDVLVEHQTNESKWFLKLDIKNFFPSCTQEFILSQLSKLFPFGVLMRSEDMLNILKDIVHICLLNGALPQGTPMSPLLTNLIMVPIDYSLANTLRDFDRHNFIYTRYADDLLISCKYNFDWQKVQQQVNQIFQEHSAPFRIKAEKTRYGSSAGRNWNLGLMLNKDNQITIGHQKKQRLKATIFSFLQGLTNNQPWDKVDVQVLLGNISYYRKIEPGYVDALIAKYSTKFNKDFMAEVKRILKA